MATLALRLLGLLACVCYSIGQSHVRYYPTPGLRIPVPADSTLGQLSGVSGVFFPVTPGYDEVRKPWQTFYQCNAYPTVVVQAASPADVIKALLYAEDNHLKVTVRNGGHSYAGISRSYGLVLDMSIMNSTEVLPYAGNGPKLVKVGAGQINIGAYHQLAMKNLTIPAGGCPSVGISGLTLGGGFGVLSRKLGLTSDQVESIEAVVYLSEKKTYELVTVTATEYKDLFFAFRGGMGGNYGVVTSWVYRAAPVDMVYTADFELDLTKARPSQGPASKMNYEKIALAAQKFMTWCDWASDNMYCEMSVSTTPLKALPTAAPGDMQLAKTYNLETVCLCDGGNCTACMSQVARLTSMLATDAQLSNKTASIRWNKFIWDVAGCTDLYNSSAKVNGFPIDDLIVKNCSEKAQTKIGRGKHNRKKSLFMNAHPTPELLQDMLVWFDNFARQVVVDSFTGVNIEFYYWGGALAKKPDYAAESAWTHRDQKWLVHITGRFPDEADPSTIANVYYALGQLHTILAKPFQTGLQDYQNFADPSFSYEAWSNFYFSADTFKRLEETNYMYNPKNIFRNELSVPVLAPKPVSSAAARPPLDILPLVVLISLCVVELALPVY